MYDLVALESAFAAEHLCGQVPFRRCHRLHQYRRPGGCARWSAARFRVLRRRANCGPRARRPRLAIGRRAGPVSFVSSCAPASPVEHMPLIPLAAGLAAAEAIGITTALQSIFDGPTICSSVIAKQAASWSSRRPKPAHQFRRCRHRNQCSSALLRSRSFDAGNVARHRIGAHHQPAGAPDLPARIAAARDAGDCRMPGCLPRFLRVWRTCPRGFRTAASKFTDRKRALASPPGSMNTASCWCKHR